MKNTPLWQTRYPKNMVPLFIGRKYKHSSDLLAGLSLKGPCTTRDVAKYVLKNTPTYEYGHVRDRDSSILAKNYNNLINDKRFNKKRWLGLLSQKYVIKVDEILNEKNATAYFYALTTKGSLVALGYRFNDNELTSFIKSAASNNMYFAYINNILEKTSISFVKEIFFDPIYEIIEKNRISLDDNIGFYFSNIAEVIGAALYRRYEKVFNADSLIDERYFFYMRGKPLPEDNEIEILIKNTFYAQINFDDWIDRMINYFYPDENSLSFYRGCSDGADVRLLYKVTYSIHSAYFDFLGIGTPKLTNRLPPNSKKWKLHYKNNKKRLMLRKRLIAG